MEISTIKITEEERQLLSSFIGEEYIGHELDFNRLMPVVEKIEKGKNFQVVIAFDSCKIYDMLSPSATQRGYSTYEQKTKIEAVWKAVIDFINFYNSHGK